MSRIVQRSSAFTVGLAVVATLAGISLAACGPDESTSATAAMPTATRAEGGPAAPAAADPAIRVGEPVSAAPSPAVAARAAAVTPSPAAPREVDDAAVVTTPSTAYPAARPNVAEQRPLAHNRIGTVASIEPIRERPQGSGAGAVIGGVLGAVVGNQFGHGTGRAAMTGVGAVGGALAGNNVERNYKEHVSGYRVNVRLDNGTVRTFERQHIGSLHVGDRVRVDGASYRPA